MLSHPFASNGKMDIEGLRIPHLKLVAQANKYNFISNIGMRYQSSAHYYTTVSVELQDFFLGHLYRPYHCLESDSHLPTDLP